VSQDQLITLLLRTFLISGFLSTFTWVAVYTRLARWWGNPVGRTIVVNAVIVSTLLVPTTLALFFKLNRLDSLVTAWVDVVLIGAITPVMCWRIVIWTRLARTPGEQENDRDRPG
jgi:hypothetical protein